MAGYDGGGGGGSIGGKFRKRPFRRGPATPYDRQPARPAHTHLAEPQGKRWLSKLVDPATRIIAWSASRFLSSSIFQKRLGASPDAAPEANQKSMEEVLKEPCSTSLLEVQEQHTVNSSNASSAQQHGASVGVDEVFEIEQKLKQKVFTRAEFDRLTELLHSRTVESIKPEVALNCEQKEIINIPGETNNEHGASEVNVSPPMSSLNIKRANVTGQTSMHQHILDLSQPELGDHEKDKLFATGEETGGSIKLHLNYITPADGSAGAEEEGASPTEVAKSYMKPRHLKTSPTALSMQDKLFRKDRTLPISTIYTKKPSDPSEALRSAVDISGSLEVRSNSYMTPKLHGRSALYRMARSPYFQPRFKANLRDERSLLDGYGGPSTPNQLISGNVSQSGSRQMLKRGRSVLDDSIGSSDSIRRTRQKSNIVSHLDHGFVTSNQKLLYLNHQKNDQEDLQAAENGGFPVVPIPPRSTEMARKILQQLDKMATSPKERTVKPKIAMDESSDLLSHKMLHGQALRSMEEIDTSKFLEVHRNGCLEIPSDSHWECLGNSVPLKQDKAEENGSTKSAVKGIQISLKDSVLEKRNNIIGTATKSGAIAANFTVPGAATISIYKKPSFHMSAPEDFAEMDDDSYDILDSRGRATVDNKSELTSEPDIIPGEKTNTGKFMDSSYHKIHMSGVISGTMPKKASRSCGTEKANGILFSSESPLSRLSQPPSVPTSPSFLENSVPQKEQVPASTSKTDLEAYPSGFSLTAGTTLGASNGTTDLLESSKDKVVKSMKDGDLSIAFGNARPIGLPASTSSGLSVLETSRTSTLNDGITSTIPKTSHATIGSSFSTGVGVMSSSTNTTSSAVPIFGTISSQSGAGGLLVASGAITSSSQRNDSGNMARELNKSSAFSESSTTTPGTYDALSSSSTALPAPSISPSISSSSSTLPASFMFSTATASSAISTSSALSASSNGLFNFGSSTQSASANSLFSGNSTTFGAPTTASSFSAQPIHSGIANSSSSFNSLSSMTSGPAAGSTLSTQPAQFASTSTSITFGSSDPTSSTQPAQSASTSASITFGSSTPITTFGLSGTSSGSASSLFGFSAPASSPLGSSTGFTFPTVTGSTSSSGSSSTFSPSFGLSSGFSFTSTTAPSSTSSSGGISFVAGTGTSPLGSTSQTTQSSVSGPIFCSTSQTTQSSVSGSIFGSTSQTTQSSASGLIFGSTSQSLASGPIFGSSSQTTQSSASGPIFGSTSQSLASGPIFGSSSQTSQVSASGPIFGSTSQTSQSSASGPIFGSTSQTSQSSASGPIFGSVSSPSTGFSFGSASGSSLFAFGASSGSAFSFASVGSTNSSTTLHAQPVFGAPNQTAGLNSGSPGNDQMNVEDSMADDPVQPSVHPVSAFGQPSNAAAPPSFIFSSQTAPGGTSTFQFGSQPNPFTPQIPSAFQPAGNLEFAGGGSFSLGSGGEKSGRKIVKVRRDKHHKK